MKFVSNVKYSENVESGSIFRCMKDSISIHRIVGVKNKWYLTCCDLSISAYDLQEEDFDKAVEKAKLVIKSRIEKLNEIYSNFYNDKTDNTISRY